MRRHWQVSRGRCAIPLSHRGCPAARLMPPLSRANASDGGDGDPAVYGLCRAFGFFLRRVTEAVPD